MKSCPYCNNTVQDDDKFCFSCGNSIFQESASAAVLSENAVASESKGKGKKLVITAISAVAVIAAVVVAVILILSEINDNDDKDDEPKDYIEVDMEDNAEASTDEARDEEWGTVNPVTEDEAATEGETALSDATTEAETDTATEETESDEQELTTKTVTERPSEMPTSETTTAAPPILSSDNEFDILRGGYYYITGSMIDSSGASTPMEMAITPDSMYMLSDFSGVAMGMLIKNNTLYMIYPEKQAYLELSESIMSMGGMDMDDLTGSMDELDFSSFGSLSDADSITQEAFGGRTCSVYHFRKSDGTEMRIYMDGTRLVRIADYTSGGSLISATNVDIITATVPADKSAPPSSYTEYKGVTGMFSFMTLIEDLI